jgi:DNA-binding beta-propeller fold protein YncE
MQIPIVLLLTVTIANIADTAHAGQLAIYWSIIQDTVIRRANLDGTSTQNLVRTPGGGIPDIAFDSLEKKMYWTSAEAGGIQRSDYDGSNVETVITGITYPSRIAMDEVNRKIYWVDENGENSIWRSNLDASARELLVHDVPRPTALEVDSVNGYYYWAEHLDGTIHRTLLDNSQSSVIFDETALGRPGLPQGLAVDPVNGYLYISDIVFQAIIRMRLDGTNPELWVTEGVFYPYAIAVDPVHERVLWSNEQLAPLTAFDANVSSVNFMGLDQRIDFVPQGWFLPGYIRHMAIVEVPVPEPATWLVASAAIVGATAFALRRRDRRCCAKGPLKAFTSANLPLD